MRHPWANTALLGLLTFQLVTGYLGLVNGRSERAWILWLHGLGAYALVLLIYWKGSIILDVLGRGSGLTWQRWGFLLLAGLLLATLATGLLWTFHGPLYVAGFSLMTIHIFLAVATMGLLAWHSWRMRWILRLRPARDRRTFLRTAGLALAGLVAWRGAAAVRQLFGLRGADRRFTGSYETGSFTGQFPTVSWIADRPPPVELSTWQLALGGAVERPLRLTYDQLREWPQQTKTAVLDCTGGWYTIQQWRGVRLGDLLDEAGVRAEGRSVTLTAVSGYQRRFPLADARDYLLAVDVAGQPLSHGHGFPLRLVAPGQRGVNWVKWVTAIRVNSTGPNWQLPLPLR